METRAWGLLHAVGTPLVYAVGALFLGVSLPRFEAAFLPDLTAPVSAGVAIALLSSIASGMLPLIAALAWVDRGGTGNVPVLTVWLAIALLLLSVVFFVLLVERLTMLQISNVLAYAGDQGREVIERDYAPLGESGPGRGGEAVGELPAVSQALVHRGGPAVVQAIDVARLVALAEREGAVVVMAWAVGDTVVDGMPLLRVHGGARPVPEHLLWRLVRLGHERTFEQDQCRGVPLPVRRRAATLALPATVAARRRTSWSSSGAGKRPTPVGVFRPSAASGRRT